MNLKTALLFAALLFPAYLARADLYRVAGADGSSLYTDAPTQPAAVLVQREPKASARSKPRVEGSPRATKLPVKGRITSRVGLRRDPFGGELRHHRGIDIAVPAGTAVRPIAPGRVVFSGYRAGYGNTVVLEHRNGTVSLYAHHARNLVAPGRPVAAGEVIALAGSTGRSTGPHLHFEVWKDGVNHTDAYVRNAHPADLLPEGADDFIYRLVLADGRLLFTDVPVQ